MRGENLVGQGSLHHLVALELERLATSDALPPGLQSDEFRAWLRQGDNVGLFVEVLIARSGNLPEISRQAEERLAIEYERVTQETRKLAPGRVALAISHVYEQLRATDRGRQEVQLALGQFIAARVFKLGHSEQRQFPNEADLARVRAMAATLLEAGKRSWKMPRFVAPLTLEAHERQDGQEPRPTSASELSTAIEKGDSLVLFGPGGIGKTTFLLDLCASCMSSGRRIPLFVDAAIWARSNVSLFEYLASRPAAQGNGVTSAELTKLAEAGHLVIMLNGWNEMATSLKLVCRDELIQLTATAQALSVVVASRTSSDTPSLPYAKQIEVRGLTWKGQTAVIHAELADAAAVPLLDLLAKNTRLRHAARSPLILRGLIAQASKGVVAYTSMFDLLGAAVQAFEEDDQRHLVLSVSPVDGHQRAYLEELACLFAQRSATNCSRGDALQAIHSAASRLAERRLIGALPQPATVLDILASHHLLHIDDDLVRFAHQRFQEYFAATRLLRECIEDLPVLLRTVVNQPAWEESLLLVADNLKDKTGPTAHRVRLIKAAAAIDVGLACDLVGTCAFSEADDPELHRDLVSRVNELVASPLKEVRDLGIACQIASRLPVFAEKLWPLLESEDRETRFHTYRLNGSAISLTQLDAGAEQRIASWPPDRRIEFVHEMGDNADNYEFLVGLARDEPDPTVRAAAISSLFWHFPASIAPLQAWLDAPVEVQTEHNVMSYIQHALEEGYAGDEVRERLRTIAHNDMSSNGQLRFALAFPADVGPGALDVIFERLRDSERHGNDAPLVAIAQTHAPDRLSSLARELVLQTRAVPDWVAKYLREAPAEVKTDVFERAWAVLQGQDFKILRGGILGPLANHNQTERSVASWLQYAEADRGSLTDVDHERHRQLGYLIAHAPGGDLLNVVMQRGQRASYNEAARLVDLVLTRIGRDGGSARTDNHWLPTVDEVRQLVAVFADKVEAAEIPQNTIRVYLCSIASHVAPAEYGPFMLETCRRYLSAWSTFHEKVDQWSKKATSPRPQNPYLGLYLGSALAQWGLDALPGLLKLMAHPSAMDFIPEAIARIASLPWASKRERLFSSISTDIEEGELRRKLGREFRQPDDSFQPWTDEAGKVLGQKLSELVTVYQERKSTDEKWNAREAEYRVGRLAGVVSNIPSAQVVEPVQHALASGQMNVYGTADALRGLMRQGLHISNNVVVTQLESLYKQAANVEWHDDSSRYALSELSELLLCVTPISLLSKPIGHYLQQWRRFSYPNEIIRHLSGMHSEAAWTALLELGKELAEKGPPPEELTSALVSVLKPQYLTEFTALVANGTLFTWCRSDWALERLAPSVAAVLGNATDQIPAFLEACRQARSYLADALAGEVLSHIKGSEEICQSYLFEALDAGRAVHPAMPAYRILRGMFTLKVSIDDAQYEVTPKASNEIRAQLYARAKGVGPIADSCRRLLASVECGRREMGRPDNEPRHPAQEDGLAWTDVLGPAQ
jgi:hypothetical protein